MNRILNYIEEKSPYDYERYIAKKNNYNVAKPIRKIIAWKYAVKKYCLLHMAECCNKTKGTESEEFRRKDNSRYIKTLMQYDVVSFDVFDTLILRRILDSSDVYYLVGIKLHINGFREIRQRAEAEVRKSSGLDHTKDVKLRDIYSIIHDWYDVNIDEGMKTELEIESSLCIANPYWQQVFQELLQLKKRIIITTDMYMSIQDIRAILEANGYSGYEKIYVSSEMNASKRNGKIFDRIQQDLGIDKKYIHIGDSKADDYKAAKRKGWDAIYYKNIHSVGKKYRTMNRSIIMDSVSGGIIDAELHNGVGRYSLLEEFGFNYYGRLYVGYCKWLEQFAGKKGIDKFLFLSRDGYLLHKIYKKHFGNISSDYMYVSRYALSQITVLEDMEMYIQQNIEPKVSSGKFTLQYILEDLGIDELIVELKYYGLNNTDILTRDNFEKTRDFFYKNRIQISKIYKESILAAEQYFTDLIKDCKTICVVDVGWFGTCTRGITTFLNKHMKWQGEVLGAQIGIRCGGQNIEMYSQGKLCAYVFSPDHNKEIYSAYDFGISNVVNEIVFSAPEPALLRYRIGEDGKTIFEFLDEPVENMEKVVEIQRGVYKYVEEFCSLETKLGIKFIIPAESAYQPIMKICKKRKYINYLVGDYVVQRFASTRGNERIKADKI